MISSSSDLLWAPAQRKRATTLYFANVFLLIDLFILWPPYSPALVNRGSRKFYTWWTLSVIEEVTTWIFSWSSLNYRVAKKWRNLAYFQTTPANFLLSRPNAAEYRNSEKNLLSTDGFSAMYATFGELWPTNPWDPRDTKFLKMTRVNNLWHVLFPFARCQHDHTGTPKP